MSRALYFQSKNLRFFWLVVFLCGIAPFVNAQEVKELEMGRCVPVNYGTTIVINDQNGLWSAIRNDASRDNCIIEIQKLDLDLVKNTLVGVNISSGYCGRPPGLSADVVTNAEDLTVTVNVRYDDRGYERCAALSRFEYWLAVTKPPQGFTIKVDVGPRQTKRETN